MIHSEETTLLQQEVHLERNTKRIVQYCLKRQHSRFKQSLSYTVIFTVAKNNFTHDSIEIYVSNSCGIMTTKQYH